MIPPSVDAAGIVHTFYVIETDEARMEEAIPAYSAQLIIMVRGQVEFTFANGTTGRSGGIFINAPLMRSARALLEGPVLQVGASLTHTAWQRLANLPADAVHDRLIPAEAVLPAEQLAALEAATAACREGEIPPDALCDHLTRAIAAGPHRLHDDHVAVVNAILGWLARGFDPALKELYDSVSVSPRQVQRISRRFFGVAPAQVLKRFRALRAGMLLSQPGISVELHDQLMATYFDQAHLIRDIRRYTGRTPTQYRQQSLTRQLFVPRAHGEAGAPLKSATE